MILLRENKPLDDAVEIWEEGEQLRFWSGEGRYVRNRYSFLPLGHDGVTFLHRHRGVLDKHLRAFTATPRKKAQEMFFAHVLCAGWGVNFGLAALDYAVQFVHGGFI
jgi:hypothetical protein